MQIECNKCRNRISYEDTAPKFCSECGESLIQSLTSFQADETIARTPVSDVSDISAVTIPPDQTKQDAKSNQAASMPMENVGPYQLVRKLGQGGMGTVYEAVHTDTGQNVALKLLSPAVRGTEEMVQRFRRESQIAASINHPRSTFVYEAGQHEDQLFITMELMGGGTLKEVVAEDGPLPVGRAVDYLLDMIDGLLVAHNAGIVHRDLKPSNSFVDAEGRIKVGDFGLAKSFLGDSSLTQTGTFMGTPQYAAPEQIRNADVDERTDIYALGGTLFYLLTGRAPFVGNPAQVISSIASDIPPKVNEFAKDIPKPLVKLISQTLEKDPERRPFNLNVMRDGLLPYSTRGAIAADPGRRMAAFFFDSFLTAFVGVIVVMFFSPVLMFLFGMLRIPVDPQVTGSIILLPFVILYYSVCESQWGRTLGKWVFGMRVIDKQGQTPSFLAVFVRALLIPGLSMAVGQAFTLLFVDTTNIVNMNDVMAMSFQSQAFSLLTWVVIVGMVSTARKENGYQCVHGYLSNTRVVRLSGDLESRLLDHFPVTVAACSPNKPSLGEFEVVGRFSSNDGQTTYLGRDKELDRSVWIFDGFAESPISEERRHLTRASRLRIIKQSSDEGRNWYATESVPGIPLMDVLDDPTCQWKSFCPLVRDIAYELSLSEDGDMIPDNISEDHFWLDHTGRVRVLDHLLIASVGNIGSVDAKNPQDKSHTERKIRAAETIIDLLRQFMARQDHPVDLMAITDELEAKKNDESVFEWLVTRLSDSQERPSTWNPVDRLGMMAISVGVELSLISAVIFIASYLVMLLDQSSLLQTLLSTAAGLVVVAASGYFLNGGLATHLSGVAVRRSRDKNQASRLKTMWRNIIAWSPWVVLMSLLMFLIFYQLHYDPEVTNVNSGNSDIVVPLILLSLIPCFFIAIGTILAIFNPRRGLQDFLVGTRLMRN